MRPLDVLIALSVPINWGMGFVLAKPAVAEFPPILLMAFRFLISALVLVWFVPRPPTPVLWQIFWVALIGSAIQYGLTFNGLRILDASTAALIVQAEVPFATLLAAVWLRERLAARKILGMAVAFVGIYLIAGEPTVQGQTIGVLLVLLGSLCWAIGQVMMRRLGSLGGFTAIAWISAFAAPQLFAASWLIEFDEIVQMSVVSWQVWATIVYLGLIMNVLGYACWYHVLGRYEVNRSAPYLLLLPVASVVGAVLILGESPSPLVITGGVIVIAGVALIIVERVGIYRSRSRRV